MNKFVRVINGMIAASLLFVAGTAQAQDATLGLEAGVAAPLTKPQTDHFTFGGSGAAKIHLGILPFLDVAPGVSVLALSGIKGGDTGIAVGLGGGLRLKRPFEMDVEVAPWVDSNLQYVRTGSLDRLGWDVGAGLAFPAAEDRSVWVGPFARYSSVFDDVRAGWDTGDSKTLIFGLALELGPSKKAAPLPQLVEKKVPYCPDRDKDGVPDSVDRCPDVPGPVANHGCPATPPPALVRETVIAKHVIQFKLDSDKLDSKAMADLNVAVKQIAAAAPGDKIVISGHASSEGPVEHNNKLSTRRAQAVLEYLVAHGVTRDRLSANGFGSKQPVDSNKTQVGREQNRRASFVVVFIAVKEGKK